MGKNFYLMFGSSKEVMDTTNNRAVYNRARKDWLETGAALIHCSYCQYHRGENRTTYYGGFKESNSTRSAINYPSWKIASKGRKQWMGKNRVVEVTEVIAKRWGRPEYTYIEFEIGKGKGSKNGIKYSKR